MPLSAAPGSQIHGNLRLWYKETQAWQVLSGIRGLPSHDGLLVSVFLVKISALSVIESGMCTRRQMACPRISVNCRVIRKD